MMQSLAPIEPVDYLIIGHIAQDLTSSGSTLGGTAAYAALTARSIGLRVGILTSCSLDLPLDVLDRIPIRIIPSEHSTTFQNTYTPTGRIQHIHHLAQTLDASMVPETWKSAPIVHLGPIAQEIDPRIVHIFSKSMIGITPQGWMRSWDKEGKVSYSDWLEADFVLQHSNAAVISLEDVEGVESRIENIMSSVRVLAVTEGREGARVYWNGDVRRIRPPQIYEGDSTGAGDIFAASFFVRYAQTRDPWEAARFANQLASISITRSGLSGVPTPAEVQQNLMEIIWKP